MKKLMFGAGVVALLIAGSAAFVVSKAGPAEDAAWDLPGWRMAREAGIFGFPEDRFRYAFSPSHYRLNDAYGAIGKLAHLAHSRPAPSTGIQEAKQHSTVAAKQHAIVAQVKRRLSEAAPSAPMCGLPRCTQNRI
jgi:hypothetical protein